MSTKTNHRKIGELYAGLGPKEIRRMQAKLAREHKPDEMTRLGRAIGAEFAEHYNKGLRLLRVINGNVPEWIVTFHLGMERDRVRVQNVLTTSAMRQLMQLNMYRVWDLVPYPVTEREYRAMVKLERSEPTALDDFADVHIWGVDAAKLRPELAALNTPVDEMEQEAWDALSGAEEDAYCERFNAGVVAAAKEAIKRRELPKPRRMPKDAAHDATDGLWFTYGALHDWAKGTTEETFELSPPTFTVPIIGVFDDRMKAAWDIRPDSEADAVKARREAIRAVMLDFLRVIMPPEERTQVPTFDPPLTQKERERAREQADGIHEAIFERASAPLAEIALDAARGHAAFRAQLEDLLTALETIRREDFGGEDPLMPEFRAGVESAQAEGVRFDVTWEQADVYLRRALREAQGLEGWPEDDVDAPAPMPTAEHDVEYMLRLIREWGE